MRVTRIAFGMLWHARLQALLVEVVAEITPWSALGHLVGFHLPLHLLRVHMIAMREALDTKLNEPRRKLKNRSLRWRGLVADDAHLAFGIGEVFRVTLNASRVTRQYRLCVVVCSDMTDRTILSLDLVLLAIVIKRRDGFDHFRVDNIEW